MRFQKRLKKWLDESVLLIKNNNIIDFECEIILDLVFNDKEQRSNDLSEMINMGLKTLNALNAFNNLIIVYYLSLNNNNDYSTDTLNLKEKIEYDKSNYGLGSFYLLNHISANEICKNSSKEMNLSWIDLNHIAYITEGVDEYFGEKYRYLYIVLK